MLLRIFFVILALFRCGHFIRIKQPHEAMEVNEMTENNKIEDFFVRELLEAPPVEAPKINIKTEEVERGVGCSVGKNGTLGYGLLPSSVIDTEEYLATIEKDAFILRFKEKQPSIFRRFSLQAIQMPLETMDRTRECFRMFYKASPISFCATSTRERDEWMSDLTEAVFCINSAKEIVPEKLEAGEEVILPAKSTKEERWEEELENIENKKKQKEEEDAEIPETAEEEKAKSQETTEIEIKEILEGKPQVFINGEKLPVLNGPKRSVNELISEDE